jgi:hypothetical protein
MPLGEGYNHAMAIAYGLGTTGSPGPGLRAGTFERHAVAPGLFWPNTAVCGAQVRLCEVFGGVLEYSMADGDLCLACVQVITGT